MPGLAVVQEDPGSDGEEVFPVLPVRHPLVHQLDVELVDQGRRLEGVVGPLPLEVAPGLAAEVLEDKGDQSFAGGGVTLAPGVEEAGQVRRIERHHLLC